MSQIDDLTHRLCPSGVEIRPLAELATYSDTRVSAEVLNSDTFVGVDNLLPDKAGKTVASYTPNSSTLTAYERGDVLLGNIRPYLKKIWLATDSGGCSGDVLAIRIAPSGRALLPEFLFYVLSADRFFAYDMQHAKGAKMPRGSKEAILRYPVPLPPLEVQSEIVRVLDLFRSLEAELEAELEARLRQYAYYRDSLLSPSDLNAKWTTLAAISRSVSSGGTPLVSRPEYYGGDIPWLRTQEVTFSDINRTDIKITELGLAMSSAKWIPANCVIIAISGATAARVGVNKIPLATNQHCCNLEIDESQAEYRYVFHWMSNEYERLKALGHGARQDLNSGIIGRYPIAIPSLQEQQRIVAILDKFDALVNDLSIGLPAELAARRKQYEYYRDRLLTFKEVA